MGICYTDLISFRFLHAPLKHPIQIVRPHSFVSGYGFGHIVPSRASKWASAHVAQSRVQVPDKPTNKDIREFSQRKQRASQPGTGKSGKSIGITTRRREV
jgi:hypothetical protein